MSRQLVVLRHAKSAWPPGVADHDRPLEARGVRDAGAAGEWLRDNVGVPDHVVVSSALRARETWSHAAGPLDYVGAAGVGWTPRGPLTIDPRVYDASTGALVAVLRELPERARTVVLVGHNPGCEDLVDHLAATADPDAAALLALKYPTCGLAVLDVHVPWPELTSACAHLASFVAPRG